jgi:hypothetical protein
MLRLQKLGGNQVEGQPAVITPGMKGKVISLHDGFHLDVTQGEAIPPKAIVQFENGMRLMVDERMKWERATETVMITFSICTQQAWLVGKVLRET